MSAKTITSFERDFGARMRKIRKAQRISQETLAKKLGISFQQVQKYENGTNRMSVGRAIAAAEALGTDLPTLLGLDMPLSSSPPAAVKGELKNALRSIRQACQAAGVAL